MISSLQLAKLCGVSQGTVDRALHDRGRISATTRKRVLDAAARHGYAPNPAARELMTGASALAGAIIPAVNSIFFMDLLEELRAGLRATGCRLLISPAGDAGEALLLLREFAARRLRAACIVPPTDTMTVPPEITRRMPVLTLVNPCAGRNTVFVAPDERRTGRDGVKYLLSKGHRRILFLSYPRRSWAMVARENGYRSAMREIGETPRILMRVDEPSLLRGLASYRPTALFCHNDWLAQSAIRYLNKNGFGVPAGISVLGVDDSPDFMALFPGLTTLRYPSAEIARRVVDALNGKRRSGPAGTFRVVERETVLDARAGRRTTLT